MEENSIVICLRDKFDRSEDINKSWISSEYLTVEETSTFCRIIVFSLREFIRSGKIPFYKLNDSYRSIILLKSKELKKFIKEGI